MRICIYTGTMLPKVGGHELVVDALARQFQQLGHQVVMLAPRPSKFWQVRDRRLPYPVVRHPRFVSSKHWVDWYRHALLKLHRKHQFDVIHTHGVYHVGYVASLCRGAIDAPIVMTSHGCDVDPTNPRFRNPVLRKRHTDAMDAAAALIAISQFTHDGYLFLDPAVADKIIDLPNGVDTDALATPVPRPARIDPRVTPGGYAMFIGRLHARKGVDVLLRAVAQTPASGGVDLVIAGDGPERQKLEQLTSELGVAERVWFAGLTMGDEKYYLLQNSLFNVAPSRGWEGLPLVALESFAAGKPIIASDLPGFAQVVHTGENGKLVPEESPAALAEAMTHFFHNRPYVAQLGTQAREFAQGYSWRAIAEKHLELYEELRRPQRTARHASQRAA